MPLTPGLPALKWADLTQQGVRKLVAPGFTDGVSI